MGKSEDYVSWHRGYENEQGVLKRSEKAGDSLTYHWHRASLICL